MLLSGQRSDIEPLLHDKYLLLESFQYAHTSDVFKALFQLFDLDHIIFHLVIG